MMTAETITMKTSTITTRGAQGPPSPNQILSVNIYFAETTSDESETTLDSIIATSSCDSMILFITIKIHA